MKLAPSGSAFAQPLSTMSMSSSNFAATKPRLLLRMADRNAPSARAAERRSRRHHCTGPWTAGRCWGRRGGTSEEATLKPTPVMVTVLLIVVMTMVTMDEWW